MKFTIDRFEGKFAVVELPNGEKIDCPKAMLPDGSKEGDVLCISVDETATTEKKAILTDKMNKLFRD